MNRLFNIKLCLLLFITAFNLYADPPIFKCIEVSDMQCVKKEIKLNPSSWNHVKNHLDETPLMMAITLNKLAIAKYLIKHGAGDSQIEVVRTFKILFKLKKQSSDSVIKPTDDKKNSADLVRSMMIAATNDEVDRDNTMVNLAKIIDLFADKITIANQIRALYREKILNQRDINILISHYYDLFLRDEYISSQDLKQIINILLPVEINHYLILFIIDAYINSLKQQSSSATKIITAASNSIEIDDVVNAIVERTRIGYSKLPPKIYVDKIINKKNVHVLDKFITESDNLSNFVVQSILYPEKKAQQIKNYEFWHLVYQKLVKQQDLRGAFAVATGLKNSEVVNHLPKKYNRPIAMVKLDDNFKQYRALSKKLENSYHFPSIVFPLKDLSMAAEYPLFKEGSMVGGKKLLDQKTLLYFAKFRAEYEAPFRYARSFVYTANQSLTRALYKLPTETYSQKWHTTYQLIMACVAKNSKETLIRSRSAVAFRPKKKV